LTEDKIAQVITLVARTLEIPEHELAPDSSMENTPQWDSVAHISICLAFEQSFRKTLDMDAITTATTIQALASLVP
jgi:acyl carrier protein